MVFYAARYSDGQLYGVFYRMFKYRSTIAPAHLLMHNEMIRMRSWSLSSVSQSVDDGDAQLVGQDRRRRR
jgi:hypothetical protein